MNIATQEQGLLVKNAYPEAKLEECKKCGYFLKYLAGARASENGKYFGVCICAKTGKRTGPLCQPSS